MTEILLKVALNAITLTLTSGKNNNFRMWFLFIFKGIAKTQPPPQDTRVAKNLRVVGPPYEVSQQRFV
jgi:hypothetical protein